MATGSVHRPLVVGAGPCGRPNPGPLLTCGQPPFQCASLSLNPFVLSFNKRFLSSYYVSSTVPSVGVSMSLEQICL